MATQGRVGINSLQQMQLFGLFNSLYAAASVELAEDVSEMGFNCVGRNE